MFEKIIDGTLQSRILHAKYNGLDFITPNYIPSFSSRDDNYLKNRIMGLLNVIPQQTVLISAYDYYMLEANGHITSKFIHNSFRNKLLFLDSGGYELQFSNKDYWSADKYKEILYELKPSFFVGYDEIPSYESKSNTLNIIDKEIRFLKKFPNNRGRVLLLHFSTKNKPISEIDAISKQLKKYICYFDIIGFPEREIGANIIQRATFIKKFREKLNKENIIKPLHVFGCSDPISIILYIFAGADLFDGLGWIKYTFDNKNFISIDRAHLPFLDCNCPACKNKDWSSTPSDEYEYNLLAHNLYAYDNFFYELRNSIIRDECKRLTEIPKLNEILRSIFGGV